MATTTPTPASAGSAAAAIALRRFSGPSYASCDADRIAPTTTIGLAGRGSRSQAKAVSSMTSVPCTTTAPSMSGRPS